MFAVLTMGRMKMIDPKKTVELLKSLPEEELKELLRTTALITDPLSQELMRKAAESPITNKENTN